MDKTHTVVRITKSDYERVKKHLVSLRVKQKYGRYAQPDVITMLLDSYENINQTNEKSNETDKKAI